MEARNSELPPRPPGAVNALINGFNALTGNISVILFPVALDVFLWLGPRLKLEHLLLSTLQEMAKYQDTSPMAFPWLPSMFSQLPAPAEIEKTWDAINLFALLRTYPLGIFSLMMGNTANHSPIGVRLDWDITSWFALAFVFLFLMFTGLLLGSLYFYFVSRVALKSEKGPGVLRATFHSLLISAIWTFLLVMSIPLLQIALPFLSNNPIVIIMLFLLLAWPVTWLCLIVFFSTHAVFTHSKNAFASLLQNFRVLRYGLPPMGWFALMAVIISHGMDLLWRIPSVESWMMLVGIFGHAFISTGLLSASFIFYRDLSTWVEEALQWIKTHQVTSAQV